MKHGLTTTPVELPLLALALSQVPMGQDGAFACQERPKFREEFFSSRSYADHSWSACFSSGHGLFSFRSLGLALASCLDNQLELVGSDSWTHAFVRDQGGNKGELVDLLVCE